jgi:hypothetical protein
MVRNEKTSVRVAALAARILAGAIPTLKEARTLAASVLTQAPERKKR